ncbi:MAG: biotin--[acetyl-CoA-carboxylase] ligase [Azoarcus sp.]|jgi:BirA family biotin operon repressor/biotin-[acetyl-CoA-carboxylase] ligase|nr:biotin--[acetyl-CoA-carboxylase] ligase [Azoarcus sp.]
MNVPHETLSSAMPAPDLAALSACLGPLAGAFAVRWVAHCASTNSALLEAPPDDDGRAHVLVATRQSAGRGRRGRAWLAWPDASLTFSVLWRFAPGAPAPAGLSLAVGLALARALEKLGVPAVALKWPNDVLAHGAKLAGVLVELLPGRDRALAAVIGIGINMRLPAGAVISGQEGVADLAGELNGALPAREVLLAAILAELHPVLTTYACAGFDLLRGAWQRRNAFASLPVRVSGEGTDIAGLCLGVDEDGALLVRGDEGTRRVLAGEVSLRLAS